MTLAERWISERLGPVGVESLMNYLAHDGPFVPSFFAQNQVAPKAWWKAGIRLGFPVELAELALDLMTAVASTPRLENIFFPTLFIHLIKVSPSIYGSLVQPRIFKLSIKSQKSHPPQLQCVLTPILSHSFQTYHRRLWSVN